MADASNKNPKNVAGPFYVDMECIGCGMCHELANEYFVLDEGEGLAYVAKQPTTDEGNAMCMEAKNSCPVDAIGDDGK